MAKKYTPAIFQANIRPSWSGIISYISDEEKALILEAIFKYPQNIELKSKFWLDTIKPDLDNQYNQFIDTCQAKGRASKTYWENKNKEEDNISLPCDNLEVNSLKDKSKDNSKDKNKNQLDNQDENQDTNQVIDKDKDIDLNIETLFFDFWENYTPIKCNGKFVDKGSRKISFEKFSKIIKSGVKYENIISGLHAYLNHCRANNQLTCGVPVFLNQQRWLDDYNSTTVDSTNTTGERQEPRSMLEVYAEIANQYK